MRRAIDPLGLERDEDLAVWRHMEAILCHRRTEYVAAEPLEPRAVVGGDGDRRVQVEALEARASGAAIFVYPDATEASGRSFDLETPRANNADMQLFVDMLAALRSLYCVDPTRVFATGLSRGAYFANFLNCRFGTEYVAGSCCRYCTIILTSGGPLCDGLRRGELH